MLQISPELARIVRESKGIPVKESFQNVSTLTYLKKDGVVQTISRPRSTEILDKNIELQESKPEAQTQVNSEGIDLNFFLKLPSPVSETSWDHDSCDIAIESPGNASFIARNNDTADRLDTSLPVLLINLNSICGYRVIEQHVPEIVKHLKQQLFDNFETRTDELFELGVCMHSTSSLSAAVSEQLIEASGGDMYAEIEYPTTIDGKETINVWNAISCPGSFEAVEVTLKYLRACGRSLSWKLMMRQELDRMGNIEAEQSENLRSSNLEQEFETWKRRRRGRLRRLVSARDTFQSRLDLEEKKFKSGHSVSNTTLPFDMLQASKTAKLELERRLEQIDELIAELELEETDEGFEPLASDDECDFEEISAVLDGFQQQSNEKLNPEVVTDYDDVPVECDKKKEENSGKQEVTEESMTLIDKIAAMILGRMPRIPRASDAEHIQYISLCHKQIRTAWIEEFGRLPEL